MANGKVKIEKLLKFLYIGSRKNKGEINNGE
jgi:hypothetical protein